MGPEIIPPKKDYTIRWDRDDLARLEAAAQSMGGMSTAALVRWVVLGWLERQGEKPHAA